MKKDIFILVKFIYNYCRHNHAGASKSTFKSALADFGEKVHLCDECISLANYSIDRRVKCPQKNKPSCKKCTIKCYSQEHGVMIRKVMKFSGIYFVKRGRIDYLIKYFF